MELIIVLGSRINGSEIHDELKGRLDVAIKVFNSGSKLLLSGGITNHDLNRSEAQFMKDYCIANGIPEASIILEEKSLDTIGNGVFCAMIVHGKYLPEVIYVVSSCYHMERSEFIFEKCFGPGYRFDFSHCFSFNRPDMNEKESTELARRFFSGILDGDIDSIKERLFNMHNLYIGQ